MPKDDFVKMDICARRYQQRRSAGKAGWADETSYSRKKSRIDSILAKGLIPLHCRFLELGCGNGNVALYMAGKGHDAHGVDIVPEAIDWATANARQQKLTVKFEKGSVINLASYNNDYFDFVFDANCFFMIIGKKERKQCLENVFRVLKPGGIFYVEAHLLNEQIKERIVFSEREYFDPQEQYSTCGGQPMYYFSRKSEFIDSVKEVGFKILHHEEEQVTQKDMPFYIGDIWMETIKP